MEHRLVIHGSFLGGYGLPGSLAAVAVLGGLTAVLSRIWANPAALALWLLLFGLVAGAVVRAELIYRRNFVEVGDERIRWFFRQPPRQGEESMSNLRAVTIYESGALLDFTGGAGGVVLDIADFRKRDIIRLVEAVRQAGVPVDDSRGPIESVINGLLGRNTGPRR